MCPERPERKAAAIRAADVAGYSGLMGVDEEGTIARLKMHRRELIDPKIVQHQGRVGGTKSSHSNDMLVPPVMTLGEQ
jgi:class 3 adenylate cyclase